DHDEFLWPGFGENSRILKWALERIEGTADAEVTPIGNVPTLDSLDLTGLKLHRPTVTAALAVHPTEWASELPLIDEWYATIGGNKLPDALREELRALRQRLSSFDYELTDAIPTRDSDFRRVRTHSDDH
ncbi:phosphoenolpyruvate carboxykinase domain-containing protein, partial [Williamsia sp.]|uniref:phosphoenolpyruvate carboxykinase domain-containing protein n=1 Tax=Williamsia sp. TaxID=1872085 RepID=UPI002F93AEA6